MKYAFMTFSCPELNLDQALAAARKYGYDGIEPRISAKHKHGLEFESSPAFRREARQKAQKAGIQLACLATSAWCTDATTMSAYTRQAIDLAGDLGVPRLRIFGGAFPDSMSRAQAIDTVAAALAEAAGHAQDRGVVLCMETHDAWCDPAHVAAVMQKVNHPAVGVNWDIMHPVRTAQKTVDQSFETLKPWIRHVHFHDGKFTDFKFDLCPVGEGIIDHRRAVQLLQGLGYQGYLSGEWIGWEPWETHLPRELAAMQAYETAPGRRLDGPPA